MHGVLVCWRFFHTVFAAAAAAAAMGAEKLDPIECEHMGMDVDDGHDDLVALVAVDPAMKD